MKGIFFGVICMGTLMGCSDGEKKNNKCSNFDQMVIIQEESAEKPVHQEMR